MYNYLKKIFAFFFPKKTIFKYEELFRRILYIFYMGKTYQCNICSKKLRKFQPYLNDRICPSCGSLQRNRRLWNVLKENYLLHDISILDFSPSRTLYRRLKNEKYNYLASDLSGDFIADVSYDITNINAADASYDLIICYHILEHVNNDLLAMKELYRVLKSSGKCIIQTPFKDGYIYEDTTITLPEDRLKHFGQEDHVRIYSVEGLKDRLESCGFQVNILNFNSKDGNINGFSKIETILICSK